MTDSTPNARYGLLHYDVPGSGDSAQHAAYSQIKRIIAGKAVMLSRSCYIVPLGLKREIEKALTSLNKERKFGIKYGVIRFDPVENAKTRREVILGLQSMITGAIASYKRTVERAREQLDEGKDVDVAARRSSAAKSAKRALKEAERAARHFEEFGEIAALWEANSKALQAAITLDIEKEKEETVAA